MTFRGYDVDGVLVPRKIEPIHPYVVITGRPLWQFPETLAAVGACSAIYCLPTQGQPTAETAGEWKALIIGRIGVTEFYEDDPTQAAIIRERCPGCKVIMVT
jgi:hypothetical protein